MGWMIQCFFVAQAIDFFLVQNVKAIGGAQPACFPLSARGFSGVVWVGHEVDLPRLRMSRIVHLLILHSYMTCTGATSPFTMLQCKIYFDP